MSISLYRSFPIALIVALAVIPLAYQLTQGQQPEALNAIPQQNDSVLMRAKLGSSQKVVEGLMAGDFSMIRKGGSDLAQICDSQNWRRLENQVVAHYRNELRRSAEKLVKHSDDENLEGAAYTYMHSMTICINCHEYSRNVLRIADTRAASPVISIPVTEQEAQTRPPAVIRR